jgi:hypothetical protein
VGAFKARSALGRTFLVDIEVVIVADVAVVTVFLEVKSLIA